MALPCVHQHLLAFAALGEFGPHHLCCCSRHMPCLPLLLLLLGHRLLL
jgi:hypothetical protein